VDGNFYGNFFGSQKSPPHPWSPQTRRENLSLASTLCRGRRRTYTSSVVARLTCPRAAATSTTSTPVPIHVFFRCDKSNQKTSHAHPALPVTGRTPSGRRRRRWVAVVAAGPRGRPG
jgi:hypothetical protein